MGTRPQTSTKYEKAAHLPAQSEDMDPRRPRRARGPKRLEYTGATTQVGLLLARRLLPSDSALCRLRPWPAPRRRERR
eukprot:4746006-Pyramimonas_sp.AAC.1